MPEEKLLLIDATEDVYEAIQFANWLHNNWYEPIGYDGMWRVKIEDEEYQLDHPKINMFFPNELFVKFKNGEGEF